MNVLGELKASLENNDVKPALKLLNAIENAEIIKKNGSDIIALVFEYLHEDNLKKNPDFYTGCECVLKVIAENGNREEVLFEFLEILETAKNDDIFTSALKILQIVLLRITENRARSLEWTLNSIVTYLTEVDVKESLNKYSGELEEKLLEEDATIQRILQIYITILLFVEPIHKSLLDSSTIEIYRNTKITRKNVLTCFILQLMQKPLMLLNLNLGEEKSEGQSYSQQCALKMILILNDLMKDPYYLLEYIEIRKRWPLKFKDGKGVLEQASQNIFLIDEKVPILSLATYYYLIIAENLLPKSAPRIYTTKYIFEKCLYLVVELLKQTENSVQSKGVKLSTALIQNIESGTMTVEDLELKVHIDFCKLLSKLVIYSSFEKNRKDGISLFSSYIYKFNDKGRYFLILNLLTSTEHNGLRAYIITLYKNMIADELNRTDEIGDIAKYHTGSYLKTILIEHVFKLPKDIETDLLENADTTITALNVLRFLLIRDKTNKSNICDYINEVEVVFLKPLRTALDLSKAHYKNEESVIKTGQNKPDDATDLSINVIGGDGQLPLLDKEKKLNIIACALNTFDMMDCLLSRILEIINTK